MPMTLKSFAYITIILFVLPRGMGRYGVVELVWGLATEPYLVPNKISGVAHNLQLILVFNQIIITNK